MTKNTTIGMEAEFFTIDEKGELTPKADKILKLASKKKKISAHMMEEVSHSMVEMGSPPDKSLRSLELGFLKRLKELNEISKKENVMLLPTGTYPGKQTPNIRKKPWYDARAYLFENFKDYVGRVCGFHFHYSLPKGILEKKRKTIKQVRHSKAKDIFLSQYNFLIAADPACITLCQSSPFVHGRHLAKDSRTIIYRDMVIQGKSRGLYAEYPLLGGLPDYEFTLEDIKNISIKRKNMLLDMLHSRGILTKEITAEFFFSSELRFMWGPIRVNQLGTIEYRGLDMNLPSRIFSTTYLLRLAFDVIKERGLTALPSDIGTKEPFKIEDSTIYLPPFSIVKSLEYLGSRYGFDNSSVYSYCSALFNFVLKTSKNRDMRGLKAVKEVLEKKKTVSDEILDLVKKNGYDPENVPDEFIRYLNLYYSKKLEKEVEERIKLLS